MMRTVDLLAVLLLVNLACKDTSDDDMPFDAGPLDTG
jgi:hypothetical protein